MSNVSDSIICPTCAESIPADYVVCPYDGTSLVKELREKTKVNIRFREGINRAFRLAFNPQQSMRISEEYAANPDRKGGFFVLFVCSFLYAFRLALYLNKVNPAIDIVFIFIYGVVFGLLGGLVIFVFAIIGWYVLSLIYHYSAKFTSSGAVTFKESQGLIGYMFAPLITGLIIMNILLLFIAPSCTVFSAGGLCTNVYNITASPAGSPLSIISYGFQAASANDYYLLNLIFIGGPMLWGIALGGLMTEKLLRTPRIQSFIVAAIPFVFVFWLSFFG